MARSIFMTSTRLVELIRHLVAVLALVSMFPSRINALRDLCLPVFTKSHRVLAASFSTSACNRTNLSASCQLPRLKSPPQTRTRPQLCRVHPYQHRFYTSKPPPPTSDKNEELTSTSPSDKPKPRRLTESIRENIYTFPNLLTLSRILSCPVLAWAIVSDNHVLATGLLAYAGVTDWVRSSHSSGSPVVLSLEDAGWARWMVTLHDGSRCRASWERYWILRRIKH